MVFTAVSDAAVALGRIGVALRAEETPRKIEVDPREKYAISINGDFQYASATPPENGAQDRMSFRRVAKGKKKTDKKDASKAKGGPDGSKVSTTGASEASGSAVGDSKKAETGIPFALRDISLKVPRGTLSRFWGVALADGQDPLYVLWEGWEQENRLCYQLSSTR